MFEFKLPDLGEGIQEGEILKWHVSEGDMVKEDQALVDVETDKAAVTIPSPREGKISALNGEVGDMVTVGQVVAVFDGQLEGPAEKEAEKEKAPAEAKGPEPEKPAVKKKEVEEKEEKKEEVKERSKRPVPAAPATRRLAREMGIDIRMVKATGPAGRVTVEDVKRHAEKGEPEKPEEKAAPAETAPETEYAAHAASAIPYLDIEPLPDFTEWGPVETAPLRSIRRRVAHKMVTSMTLIPHVAHMDEADVTLLEEFRNKEKERRKGQPGGRLTLLAFVMKAVTAGLKAAPSFNASLDPFKDEIIYKKYYNIGIAVDTGRGLIVPVVKDTDRKSILQVSQEIEDVARRARDGEIDLAELKGGTFTITNIGPVGGTALIAAINYPEVAILGMGRVQEKPVVRDGEIVIRKILPLTLSFDHRITDGADAARFVRELARQLSDPNLLLLET